METTPLNYQVCFRQRDISKDIQPGMKFSLGKTRSRLISPKMSMSANSSVCTLGNEKEIKIPKISQKLHFKGAIEVLCRNFSRPKKKTIFEEFPKIEPEENSIQKGILKRETNNKNEENIKKNIKFNFNEKETDREKIDLIDVKGMAKSILMKCNVFQRKSSANNKILHKGEGIVASLANSPLRLQNFKK